MPIIGVLASSDRNAPDAPTIGTATDVGTGRAYNNGAATVTFTAPVYTGGTPITGYTVTSSPGGFTGTGASSPVTVAGLQSGVAYTFTVTATNAVGTSASSAASNSITATTVPQAPTIGTATDGGTGTTVSVAFTAGATGGKTITGFTATSSPGSITGTGASSPITVSGLTTGTAYTFTVTATNANGTSAASAASNSVTPVTPSSFDSIASFTPTSGTSVTFSSIPQTYKHLQLRLMGFGTGGQAFVTFNGDSSNIYTNELLRGDGTNVLASSSTSLSSILIGSSAVSFSTTIGNVSITTITDYASTSKAKTLRQVGGRDSNGGGALMISSALYNSTNAISSITISGIDAFVSGTSIALYGIRG